jgi:hypothetical protein
MQSDRGRTQCHGQAIRRDKGRVRIAVRGCDVIQKRLTVIVERFYLRTEKDREEEGKDPV